MVKKYYIYSVDNSFLFPIVKELSKSVNSVDKVIAKVKHHAS